MNTMALSAFLAAASLGLAPNLASAENDEDRVEVASVADSVTQYFFDKDYGKLCEALGGKRCLHLR